MAAERRKYPSTLTGLSAKNPAQQRVQTPLPHSRQQLADQSVDPLADSLERARTRQTSDAIEAAAAIDSAGSSHAGSTHAGSTHAGSTHAGSTHAGSGDLPPPSSQDGMRQLPRKLSAQSRGASPSTSAAQQEEQAPELTSALRARFSSRSVRPNDGLGFYSWRPEGDPSTAAPRSSATDHTIPSPVPQDSDEFVFIPPPPKLPLDLEPVPSRSAYERSSRYDATGPATERNRADYADRNLTDRTPPPSAPHDYRPARRSDLSAAAQRMPSTVPPPAVPPPAVPPPAVPPPAVPPPAVAQRTSTGVERRTLSRAAQSQEPAERSGTQSVPPPSVAPQARRAPSSAAMPSVRATVSGSAPATRSASSSNAPTTPPPRVSARAEAARPTNRPPATASFGAVQPAHRAAMGAAGASRPQFDSVRPTAAPDGSAPLSRRPSAFPPSLDSQREMLTEAPRVERPSRRPSQAPPRIYFSPHVRRQAEMWAHSGSLSLPGCSSPRHARAVQRALLLALLTEPGYEALPQGLRQRVGWLFCEGWESGAEGHNLRDLDDLATVLSLPPGRESRELLVLAVEAVLPHPMPNARPARSVPPSRP